MNASDCKCCVCGKQAVAFWPIIDPDIPHHPYCRKCLDNEKTKALILALGFDEKQANRLVKTTSAQLKKQSNNLN